MERPSFLSLSMILNRCRVSATVSEEVGSSMMMIFALYETAFAISIACICETERFFAKVVTSISKSKSRSRFLVFSIIWFSSTTMPFVWNLPAHILSTTFR